MLLVLKVLTDTSRLLAKNHHVLAFQNSDWPIDHVVPLPAVYLPYSGLPNAPASYKQLHAGQVEPQRSMSQEDRLCSKSSQGGVGVTESDTGLLGIDIYY